MVPVARYLSPPLDSVVDSGLPTAWFCVLRLHGYYRFPAVHATPAFAVISHRARSTPPGSLLPVGLRSYCCVVRVCLRLPLRWFAVHTTWLRFTFCLCGSTRLHTCAFCRFYFIHLYTYRSFVLGSAVHAVLTLVTGYTHGCCAAHGSRYTRTHLPQLRSLRFTLPHTFIPLPSPHRLHATFTAPFGYRLFCGSTLVAGYRLLRFCVGCVTRIAAAHFALPACGWITHVRFLRSLPAVLRLRSVAGCRSRIHRTRFFAVALYHAVAFACVCRSAVTGCYVYFTVCLPFCYYVAGYLPRFCRMRLVWLRAPAARGSRGYLRLPPHCTLPVGLRLPFCAFTHTLPFYRLPLRLHGCSGCRVLLHAVAVCAYTLPVRVTFTLPRVHMPFPVTVGLRTHVLTVYCTRLLWITTFPRTVPHAFYTFTHATYITTFTRLHSTV